MAEAWVVRDIERKNLVEKLQREFFKLTDDINPNPGSAEAADAPFLDAASLLITKLENRRGPFVGARHKLEAFLDEAVAEIEKASRSPEEANALIVMFTEKLLATGLNSFRSNLQRQQLEDPKRIFHADSAMDEMPLPSE